MEQQSIDTLKECGKFATILKCILKKKGISQKDFADKVGFSNATISHYITGKSIPSSKKLQEIASALDVSPLVFFGDVDEYVPYLNSTQNSFSDALEKLMAQKGVNQSQLANAIGVSRQAVSMYIKGKMFPSFDIVMSIAQYLQVPITELIKEESETETYEEMKLYVLNMPTKKYRCKFVKPTLDSDYCECKLTGRICDLEDGKCSSLTDLNGGETVSC